MDKKTKQTLLSEIHKAYCKQVQEGPLPAQLDDAFSQQILALFDSIEGYNDQPEEKHVTILLSDLRGFTAMSESYSPLEVIDLLNRYFQAMTEVIDAYGGRIDKFMGDSIMVVFGTPEQREDDLERTLACAVDMQIRLSVMNEQNKTLGYPPLHMGIGINSGQVVAGKLGSDIYSEFTVIGDNVNLASRVESYSSRGQILLSEQTYSRAKDWIEIGNTNSISVKGKTEPVNMYELLSIQRPKRLEVPTREDRKSPRIEVNMPLRFNKVEGKSVDNTSYEGEIMDLSYGGMYIATREKFEPFTEIKFPLSLSLSANITSDVYAKIIRINPVESGYHYHLEFSSIPELAEKALKTYIDRIITGS